MKKIIVGSLLLITFIIFSQYTWEKKINSQVSKSVKILENEPIEDAPKLNLYEKLKQQTYVKALIIGDSIAQGSGVKESKNTWFNLFANDIKDKYNTTIIYDSMAKGGTTVFDGWVDYLNTKPTNYDLIILSYGQNDQGYMSSEDYGYIFEKLIRKLRQDYPLAEIMVFTESSIHSNEFPDELEKIASHYSLINIDTRKAFSDSGIPYEKLTDDKVHPNDEGYKLYVDVMSEQIKSNVESSRVIPSIPNELIYSKNNYTNISKIKEIEDVTGFKLINGMYTSKNKGDALKTTIKGSLLAVSVEGNIDGGTLEVYVDGEFIKEINCWSPAKVSKKILISTELSDEEHTVEIINTGENGKDFAGEDSEGTKTNVIEVIHGMK